MDKKELRLAISDLFQQGKVVQVTLRDLAGDFEVLGKRCGRGKGGSWLADLRHVDSGEEVTIGTAQNDAVLNVTVDGVFYGMQEMEELPPTYNTDSAMAVTLKETFNQALALTSARLQVTAPAAPEVNGVFTVVDGRQLRGRGGQVVLNVVDEDGVRTSLWSHRHSGVIETAALLD